MNPIELIDYKKPFSIKKGLKQEFVHEFSPKSISKEAVIKMKNADQLTDRDLTICEFLFNVRFATLNQVYRYLGEGSKKSSLKVRLDKLVENHIINRFILTSPDRYSKSTMHIYCLDIGGRQLLENYSSVDTSEWYTINNMKGSNIVGKNLLITEFYVRIMESVGRRLISYRVAPQLTCGRIILEPEAAFTLRVPDSDDRVHFLVDVLRDVDINEQFQTRVEKYESILSTNAWKKYFKNSVDSPILLILTEQEGNIPEIARTISEFTSIQRVRFSTDERILLPLHEKGVFLKYDVDNEKMSSGAVSVFKPEDEDDEMGDVV